MVLTANRHLPLTKEAILDASIRLFQQHGFSGLGMRQIAEQLKIKAPGLYYHFSSKETLAQHALEKYRQDQAVRLCEIEAKADLVDRLHDYSELYAEMLEDGNRPCLYLMMSRESSFQKSECADELKHFAQQNTDWLEKTLRKAGRKPHSYMNMSEYSLAELIFASFEGIMVLSLTEGSPSAAFREKSKNFLRIIVGGYLSSPK